MSSISNIANSKRNDCSSVDNSGKHFLYSFLILFATFPYVKSIIKLIRYFLLVTYATCLSKS